MKVKKVVSHLSYFFIFFLSCNPVRQEVNKNYFTPKRVNASAHKIATDSILPPSIQIAKNPVKIPAGQPEITSMNSLASPPFRPFPVIELKQKACPLFRSPEENTFKAPVRVLAGKKNVVLATSEVVPAKEGATKDHNPSNFTYYKVLHGLKQSAIRCVYQDRNKNLWFGTYSGGATKFDGTSFTHFTEDQGLNNNVVFCILEDKKGNIWFGTNGGGACCYNGKTFTHYTEANGLSGNAVYSMIEDKKGNIWFGTGGSGVSCFDGKYFVHLKEEQGLPNNFVYSLFEDNKNNIWFGTGGGACRYNSQTLEVFTQDHGLPSDIVLKITGDRKGQLWFGTVGGASRFDGKSFTNFTKEQGLSSNVVYTILEDQANAIWFGTSEGADCFDGHSFAHHGEAQGLSNNVVYSILEEKNGSLWLGTNAGLNHYNGNRFVYYTERDGLGNNVVLSILEDKKGNKWFGTLGGGVSVFDKKTFKKYTEAQGLINNTVYSIIEDKKGNIWFGTDQGISCFDGKQFLNYSGEQGLLSTIVYTMLEDKRGDLWLGTDGGGLIRFDGKKFYNYGVKQGLSDNVVYSAFEDKQGRLWFATYKGVNCYTKNSFSRITEKEGLLNDMVYSIGQDKEGNLWFGTNGGVDYFDGHTLTHFTEAQGLINNAVLSILSDATGQMWFGTRNGISKISSTKLSALSNPNTDSDPIENALFYNYTHEDGFLGPNCRRNSVIQDKDSIIWWGADALTRYVPERGESVSSSPTVNVTSIKLFGEVLDWSKLGVVLIDSAGREIHNGTGNPATLSNGVTLKNIAFDSLSRWFNLPLNLSLPYNNNSISFSYTGADIYNRTHLKYKYQLCAFDAGWSPITKLTEVSYANLPSGKYTFKVMGMNQNGNWSKPYEYSFKISPAWWQTWWFKVLLVAAALGLVQMYISLRERDRKESKRKLEVQNAELLKTNAELDRFVYSASHELRSPIASLLGLLNITIVDETDAEKIQRLNMMKTAITRLDSFIMDIIDYSRNSRLAIASEKIDFSEIFKESLEQLYYLPEKEKINVSIHVHGLNEFYSDKKRIGVIFNNLLSNSIKYHNPNSKNPYIHINVAVKLETAFIEIRDNGIGIHPKLLPKIFDMFYRATEYNTGTGLGLYITKEIIDKMGGSINVESKLNGETVFFIKIPNSLK